MKFIPLINAPTQPCRTVTQADIDRSLDSAIDNGYELDEWSALKIAEDMSNYDVLVEGIPVVDLFPFIQSWKQRRTS